MRYRLKKTVALVGMMGAGKTAIGKALANLLSVSFLDSDAEIESASNMAISEIFARDGEAFFRAKETQILARLLDHDPCILSTGGGAFLTPQNRDLISSKAISLFLEVEPGLLWS
ncbi:MAG: shikimate kinase, partial [Marinovum sp.]|nr:shikimate kinase [Marinovum sp.]